MDLFPLENSAKILIADDSALQRNLLSEVLAQRGFCVISACDGQEAVDLFEKEQPDLVILDIFMPEMDGITAAKKIRLLTCDNYIPIIFITASKNQDNLKQCFTVGGDDYIDKPFNEELLLVKIQSLLRIKALYQTQLAQKKDLLKYQEMIEQEQEVAVALYENILRLGFVETSILRYSLSPMALFNGDILLSAKAPGNLLYLLLGDFTGHGLSASVGAGPTAEIFYGMVRKGFAVTDIAIEINRKLHALLPRSMFLAATLITFDLDAQVLQVISCGLPEHYLLNKQTKVIRTIASKNVPLGILNTLNPLVQSFEVTNSDYLYLFSDGLTETENAQGQQFDAKRVIACLQTPSSSYFEMILERLQQHRCGHDQQDDITLVELQCDLSQIQLRKNNRLSKQQQRMAMDWKSSLSFTLQTLKQMQPVPIMVNLLMEIQGLVNYQEAIFQIVNELFQNAMDYGLLAMDATLKQTTKGRILYDQLKVERLNQINEGDIKFVFSHYALENGGRLVIKVQDSGRGFDFNEVFTAPTEKLHGIKSVQALCSELTYSGCGNQVCAVFEWYL